MRRKIIVFICGVSCIFALSGCSQRVDITNEESELIAEYSAGILLKYDKNYNSGLSYMLQNENNEMSESVEVSQGGEAVKPIQQSKDIELPVDEDNMGNLEEPGATQNGNLNEALGLDQFDITYTGFEFTDFYPNQGSKEDMNYVVNPKSGNKLLVLNFNLSTTSNETQRINLLVANTNFTITINGTTILDNVKTVLLDDLSTISEDIEVGATLKAVLLFEVSNDYGGEVSSLVLNVNSTDVVLQ